MTLRAALWVITGLGLALFGAAQGMPRFSNPDWEAPFIRDLPTSNTARDALTTQWHEAHDAAATSRRALEDAGAGLILLAASLWVMRRLAGPELTTPSKPSHWFLVGAIATVLLCFGLGADLYLGLIRFDFPWWADSIGIPLMGLPVILLAGLAASAVLAALVRLLPQSISLQPLSATFTPMWASLAAAPLAVGPLFILCLAIVTSPIYVPGLLVSSYLGVSLWGGAVARAHGLTRRCT